MTPACCYSIVVDIHGNLNKFVYRKINKLSSNKCISHNEELFRQMAPPRVVASSPENKLVIWHYIALSVTGSI